MDDEYQRYLQQDSNSNVVKDVFIILLAGVGVLLAMICVTYLTTMLIDWLSKRLDPNATVNTNNLPTTRLEQHDAAMAAAAAATAALHYNIPNGRCIDDYDRGSMARQANLWGLEIIERELILQKIFPTMSFIYNVNEIPISLSLSSPPSPPPPTTTTTDIIVDQPPLVMDNTGIMTKNSPKVDNNQDQSPVHVDVPTDIEITNLSTTNRTENANNDLEGVVNDWVVSNPEDCDNNNNDNDNNDEDIIIKDDTDHYRMCSICLTPYENGVRVLTGVQCQHMFHEVCCQQWLLKHDHCPYCRKNMILSIDFRNAAVQTLSPQRIIELSVIPTVTNTTTTTR